MRGIASNVASVSASGIRRFFDIVADMTDVISLGVGEPDFVTPWRLREACVFSLERGRTNYTSNWGLLSLRKLISGHLKSLYGVDYQPEDQILVTVGVSEALDLALRAVVDPGDEVIVFEPCYVSYAPCVTFAGGTPVRIPTFAEDGFLPRLDEVRAAVTPRTKAILLSYPNNPTGATAGREFLKELVEITRDADCYLISDEIYDRLTYVGTHTCVSSLEGAAERTILLNGFSKAYAMTGWRIGYAAGPRELIKGISAIQGHTTSNSTSFVQWAAITALEECGAYVENMRRAFEERRDYMFERVRKLPGFRCPFPDGAFYLFPDVSGTFGKRAGSRVITDAPALAGYLLDEAGVALVPGNAFEAPSAIRLTYSNSMENLIEAMDRIEAAVLKLN